MLAAWNRDTLTLVVFGQTGKVTLETDDLTSGGRTSTLPVTGFGPLIHNDVTLPYSTAALR